MKKMKRENGFTLVEMAIVILIFGLLLGGFFAAMTPYFEQKKILLTQERQKKIAQSIAQYVARTYLLPCPGAPDGANPVGPNLVGSQDACGTFSAWQGIVPYRVLGLSQEDVTDGYGNPFTYAIGDMPAGDPASDGGPFYDPAAANIHANCRTDQWISSGANLNPRKAYFCCADKRNNYPGDTLSIYDNESAADHLTAVMTDTQVAPSTKAVNASFGTADTPGMSVPTDNLVVMAYALVSHGKNGKGAYVFGDPNRRASTGAGTAELTNARAHRDFVFSRPNRAVMDLPRNNASGSGYFDDIVMWRTQESILRDLGGNSCSHP